MTDHTTPRHEAQTATFRALYGSGAYHLANAATSRLGIKPRARRFHRSLRRALLATSYMIKQGVVKEDLHESSMGFQRKTLTGKGF